MKKLFIISNESIFCYENNFFCDNIDMKSSPEGLNKNYKVNIIGKLSKKIRTHQINISNINAYKNLITYIIGVIKSFKEKDALYIVFSISPFTFFATLLLRLFKKKHLVYLRSDGYGEYKAILGVLGYFIYHLMFTIISNTSKLVSCRRYILKNKSGDVIYPSQLSSSWFQNHKEPSLDHARLLYVGRIKVEKGIFSLLKILKKSNLQISIVGAEKMNNEINQKNVNVYEIEKNEKNLIKHYDDNNIFVLPSFTEGHPMALLEALARQRPVIIFEEISHVINGKKGIFIAKRNYQSFSQQVEYIMKNYNKIQSQMRNNKLPTKDNFLKELSETILKNL